MSDAEAQQSATPAQKEAEDKPHDSARVFSALKRKHWFEIGSKLSQAERPDKNRAQWILLALLVVFAVMGGSFGGFLFQTQLLNPPAEVVGVCPPPAFVSGNDCLKTVTSTDAQGNTHTRTEPAGYILGRNDSRIVCTNNVCVGTP